MHHVPLDGLAAGGDCADLSPPIRNTRARSRQRSTRSSAQVVEVDWHGVAVFARGHRVIRLVLVGQQVDAVPLCYRVRRVPPPIPRGRFGC